MFLSPYSTGYGPSTIAFPHVEEIRGGTRTTRSYCRYLTANCLDCLLHDIIWKESIRPYDTKGVNTLGFISGSFDLGKFLAYLAVSWRKPRALIIVLGTLTAGLLWLFYRIDIGEVSQHYSMTEIAILAGVLLFAFILWLGSRRIPRPPKGYCGIAIALVAEGKMEQERLASDFLDSLRGLLDTGSQDCRLKIVEMPRFAAERIVADINAAMKYFDRSRCHFMIYGKAKIRKINGKQHHVLAMEGIVRHALVEKPIKDKLCREFTELFPKKLFIPEDNDLLGFEITAKWISLVVRYIAGIAAFLSRDVEFAKTMFKSVAEMLSATNSSFPVVTKIRERLSHRLAEVYYWEANKWYLEWWRCKSYEPLNKLKACIDKLEQIIPDSNHVHILAAVWHFVANRDVVSAKMALNKCRGAKSITWRLNRAFLLAYEGKVMSAHREYLTALKRPVEQKLLEEIVAFIDWVLEVEQDRVQLLYFLGIIMLYGMKNPASALRKFEQFMSQSTESQYASLRTLAANMIEEIRANTTPPILQCIRANQREPLMVTKSEVAAQSELVTRL